jgi:alkylhydroperoxidase family enzyme
MPDKLTSRQVSRLPPLPDISGDPIVQSLFEDTRARGGEIINLHLVMAHAPKIALASRAMASTLRYDALTPRDIRELVIVRTAQIVGSEYELNQHRPMALAAGISQAKLDAIANWRASTLFDARERALLAYVEAVAGGGEVDELTWRVFARHFTPGEIVELTVMIGNYYGTGLVTRALKIEVEDDGRKTSP